MAISIGTNFGVATSLPLDDRYVVADTTARNAIATGVRYDGLIVYQQDTNTQWQLQGGTVNGNWVDISSSVGGDVDGGTWS